MIALLLKVIMSKTLILYKGETWFGLVRERGDIFSLKAYNFEFEGRRKDTCLVITRSFQYFFEHRHQL